MSSVNTSDSRKFSVPFASSGPESPVNMGVPPPLSNGNKKLSTAQPAGNAAPVTSTASDPMQRMMDNHAQEMAAVRQSHSEEMALLREQNAALLGGLNDFMQQLTHQTNVQTLQQRYASIWAPPKGAFTTDLVAFWKGLGGNEKWKYNITPAELTTLLSTDTREVVAYKDTSLPAGFFETVLSRLPCLKRCSLSGTRYFFDLSLMSTVTNPFAKLVHLELQNTNCTDYDVSELSQRLPVLRTFYVNGCVHVTWEGLQQARRASTTGLTLLPANPNAKEMQDSNAMEKLWLDYTSAESAKEYRRLQGLYGEYLEGGTNPRGLFALWEHKEDIKPAQLTLLLSREKRTEFQVTCPPADAGMPEEQTLRAEMRRFCTYILPRLPKLAKIEIYDAPEFPFNISVMPQQGLFPNLKHLSLRHTPCAVSQLREFLRRVPSLVPSGVNDSNAVEVDMDVLVNDSASNPTLVTGMLDNKVLAHVVDKFGHPSQKKIL